ncbi:MAG: glycosyltransferase [Clostridiales bacterium]|nr:glycosyltransferase [Clostridiales bacterium]
MLNKEKNFVSAVIYVHDSGKQIGDFLRKVVDVFSTNFENSEIICVNDGSTDDSCHIIADISKTLEGVNTSVSIVNMSYFHGLELAMNAGSDLAIGDFVFEFDNCILDFPDETIMNVYRRALEGYDIVSAASGAPAKLSSKLFYKLYNSASNNRQKIRSESFRILSRRVINRITQMSRSVPYRKVAYSYSGLKSDCITYEPTAKISSHLSSSEKRFKRELAIDSLVMFTDFGYRVSQFMSVLMFVILAVTVLYTFIAYAVSTPVEGWTSTILFLSVVFTGVFVILTIIIKHLQIIMRLIFRRQQYSILSVEKITK